MILTLCQPVCSYSLMLWGEATNINCIFFGLTQLRLKCTINCTPGRHAIYYINDTVQESWVVTQRMPLVEQELPTLLEEFTPKCLYCSLFSFMCMFCRLFVLFSFLFWALCCLSFDLQILITTLVTSNSSIENQGTMCCCPLV